MSRLSASLVVDLVDKTGNRTKAIIGNMDRLKRAERDYMLANRNVRLSQRDRALERLMIEREADIERSRQRAMVVAGKVSAGAMAAGYIASRAYTNFAGLERRVNRIAVNADKGAETLRPTVSMLQKVADDARMSFDSVTTGLEALVASGRELDESLAFLPSVAMTAQASGAAVNDVALTADAMAGSMKVGAQEMQKAFDILVAGGNAGKFELKDMAQYLPSLLPAFAALGYEGTEGLQKIVAMLQTMRNQAGSSSEAATYLSNVLNKVYSQDTANKFKKMGVDLPKALAKARKEGRDVLDVFMDLSVIATKGDLSKMPLLFTDAEYQKGMRALLMLRRETDEMTAGFGKAQGTALKAFNQIAEDSEARIQRLSNLWDRFMTQIGSGVAYGANPALDKVTSYIDDAVARDRALSGLDAEQRLWQRQDFDKLYRSVHPGAWLAEVERAYNTALASVGRGEAKTVFEDLKRQIGTQAGGQRTASFPSRGVYDPEAVAEEAGRRRDLNAGRIPFPMRRPEPETEEGRRRAREKRLMSYPSRGRYDPEKVKESQLAAAVADAKRFNFLDGYEQTLAAGAEKLAEGGDKAGKAAADTFKGHAAAMGEAIGASAAQSFISRIRGMVGNFIPDTGFHRTTGQVLMEQIDGRMGD